MKFMFVYYKGKCRQPAWLAGILENVLLLVYTFYLCLNSGEWVGGRYHCVSGG